MAPPHNATEASRHAAKFIGSQVEMPDVSSRELLCKHSQTVRRASTSRARNLVQRPSWPIRDPFRAVFGARMPVQRQSWAPRGPSRGSLGRQEARPKAVLDARRPIRRPSWPSGGQNARFYCSFAAKCRFCAGGSLGAQLQSYKRANAPLQNF